MGSSMTMIGCWLGLRLGLIDWVAEGVLVIVAVLFVGALWYSGFCQTLLAK